MFTAKIIEPSGREKGLSVERWTFVPKRLDVIYDAESTLTVDTEFPCGVYLYLDKDGTILEEILEGDVYIMNESGRTVSDYHLGEIENT
jgi:hypothetical protein